MWWDFKTILIEKNPFPIELNGFRSAQFGMTERDVIKLIKNDFGLGKKHVSRKIHPNEKTVTLGIEVKNFYQKVERQKFSIS